MVLLLFRPRNSVSLTIVATSYMDATEQSNKRRAQGPRYQHTNDVVLITAPQIRTQLHPHYRDIRCWVAG